MGLKLAFGRFFHRQFILKWNSRMKSGKKALTLFFVVLKGDVKKQWWAGTEFTYMDICKAQRLHSRLSAMSFQHLTLLIFIHEKNGVTRKSHWIKNTCFHSLSLYFKKAAPLLNPFTGKIALTRVIPTCFCNRNPVWVWNVLDELEFTCHCYLFCSKVKEPWEEWLR